MYFKNTYIFLLFVSFVLFYFIKLNDKIINEPIIKKLILLGKGAFEYG